MIIVNIKTTNSNNEYSNTFDITDKSGVVYFMPYFSNAFKEPYVWERTCPFPCTKAPIRFLTVPERGIRKGGSYQELTKCHVSVVAKSLKHVLLSGAPFSDPPLGRNFGFDIASSFRF